MHMSLHSARYKLFVAKLIEARQRRRLTQAEAARRLNMPRSRLSRMENGVRRVDVIELQDFAKLYRKPLGWFVK